MSLWYVGVFEALPDGTAHLIDRRRFVGSDGRREAYFDFVRRVGALSGHDDRRITDLPGEQAPYMGTGALVNTNEGPRVVAYHAEIPRA